MDTAATTFDLSCVKSSYEQWEGDAAVLVVLQLVKENLLE
jgi:hypothetical protein